MPIKICPACKKSFKTRSNKRKFCSHPCYSNSMRGVSIHRDVRGYKNSNWRGGKRIDKRAYVLIHTPYHPFCDSDGYVREHRLIMEKRIKRFLSSEEVVHHMNKNISDNRIENLSLMKRSDHNNLHLKEAWKSPLIGKSKSRRGLLQVTTEIIK